MSGSEDQASEISTSQGAAAEEAVNHLQEAITSGKHWYIALLESIGLWTAPEEIYNGQHCQYVIADEAFDWILLAKRLCEAVDALIPQEESEQLLIRAKPPLDVSTSEFRQLVGSAKYRALLNYWYGVEVEGALLESVEADIRKERMAAGLSGSRDISDQAFRRVYGAPRKELFRAFREERTYPDNGTHSVSELKEFTYWLFKYRLIKHDKARVASDTKRGIEQLQSMARQLSVTSVSLYQDPSKIIDLAPKPR